MYLVTVEEKPERSIPSLFAYMPIRVIIQLERAAVTVSVGEKAFPFPLLSIGASVIKLCSEAVCVTSVRRSPRYFPVAVDIINLERVKLLLTFDYKNKT